MELAILETNRRREIQEEYNRIHNITPKTIIKAIPNKIQVKAEVTNERVAKAKMTKLEKEQLIEQLNMEMLEYAKDLNFEMAAQIRDAIMELKGKN